MTTKQDLKLFEELTVHNAKELLELDDYFNNVHDIRVDKHEGKHSLWITLIIQFDRDIYVEEDDLHDFEADYDFVIKYHEVADGRYQVTFEKTIRR